MEGVKRDELVMVGRYDTLVVSGFSNKDSAGNDHDDAIAANVVTFLRRNVCGRLYDKVSDRMAEGRARYGADR